MVKHEFFMSERDWSDLGKDVLPYDRVMDIAPKTIKAFDKMSCGDREC